MLFSADYISRFTDEKISSLMSSFGAVCVYGPRQCGTTTTALHHALSSGSPRFIDDWQEFPEVSGAVITACAETWKSGLFVASSSEVPDPASTSEENCNGRTAFVHMSTMSLYELGISSGFVTLRQLFDEDFSRISTGTPDIREIYRYCLRGGWPQVMNLDDDDARLFAERYLNIVADSLDETKGRLKRGKILNLIKALAGIESEVGNTSDILQTIGQDDSLSLSRNTLLSYLDSFERLMLIEEQPAFIPAAKVSRIILKTPKRRFTDPSLVTAALDITPDDIIANPDLFSRVFDNLCVHELRVYAEAIGAKVYHYRDSYGVSADAIVQLEDGRWGAFKHILNPNDAAAAAIDLLKLEGAFRGTASAPCTLCIICGLATEAYTRPDGVKVLPITALKP